MLVQLIPFITASILLTLSPGPDIIYVLVQSISNGKKAGIITTLGLVSGILIHTSLVAFGVSAVIKASPILFTLIKIFGALYLFYLAYKVFKSDSSIAIRDVAAKRMGNLFRQGFIMNVLNPKVTVFFLAFFPGFLWEPEGNTILQFYILGILFLLQALLIFGAVALLAGKISHYLLQHKQSGVLLKWIQIVVFIGIGVLILI
ncbi:threonine/homoserine/homoserine lactone efflux protein [Gillisia sp. Hel_I_86]|uniref:LysE family translocator n=1 Tax=Gillisia sp. Hel_I_86 TaxID=1249981 RepID=UPI001199673B|nr:LysE family translocator [Gillisia sp. Hel_I_86]TVZ27440.1 threonine/homoserine/homoserine lactone efflux protein [Gillisia sp. Hel_I_86]